jgi:hypothetical protein
MTATSRFVAISTGMPVVLPAIRLVFIIFHPANKPRLSGFESLV